MVQDFYRHADYTEIVTALIVDGSLALVNGVSNNIYVWFRNGWNCPWKPNIVLGCALFIAGEFGNGYHHRTLSNLRKKYRNDVDPEFTGRVLPVGGLFDKVSCPHYLFESMTWFGWMFICSFSTASIALFGITFFTLIPKAYCVHNEYRAKFGSAYPAERKMIIPFIL